MARTFTPVDCHIIMDSLVKSITGQSEISVVDTSSFISAGETVLTYPKENIMNAISITLGKLIVASRPYSSKMKLVRAENSGMYSNRIRKISYYSKGTKASGWFDTDLFTNLSDGFTNGQNADAEGTPQSTKSMWEQDVAVPLEMVFGGTSTWQDCLTRYENQLQQAFSSERDFANFIGGILTEKANDIESQKESFDKMVILNHIGGMVDMGADMNGSVINLTELYNDTFGTSYTSEELRTTYAESFYKFFVATFKKVSDFMEERSLAYHWSPDKQIGGVDYVLLRHTPKARQKALLYGPLFTEAEAYVLPQIFNPQYLDLKNYEKVDYWQNNADEESRPKVSVTPAIPDKTTGTQKKGNAVNLDYVVGMIFDSEAIMTDYQLETARTTPIEARKGYMNTWWTFARNGINDFTEKAVLFIMKDGE